jgi:hypothetical protein
MHTFQMPKETQGADDCVVGNKKSILLISRLVGNTIVINHGPINCSAQH